MQIFTIHSNTINFKYFIVNKISTKKQFRRNRQYRFNRLTRIHLISRKEDLKSSNRKTVSLGGYIIPSDNYKYFSNIPFVI